MNSLEAFEKIYDSLSDLPYSIKDEYIDIVYKHLKALEIMKTKLVIEKEDFFYDDVLGYMFVGNIVSKEEYDLLKEVLKWHLKSSLIENQKDLKRNIIQLGKKNEE